MDVSINGAPAWPLPRAPCRATRFVVTDIDRRIQSKVDGFVAELSALVRKAALDAVHEALGAAARGERQAGARGRAAAKAKRTPAKRRRGRGAKRKPEELAALAKKLHVYIQAHKGQGIEAIARGLRMETRELTLPIKKLLSEKRVSTQGQRRATRYFAR